jgi:hypothetical protein
MVPSEAALGVTTPTVLCEDSIMSTSKWLDTETKAILQPAPPDKLAPPDTGVFTLVLLRTGNDLNWVIRALMRLPGMRQERAMFLASQPCSLPVARSLSLADAMLGQFELICCDSISVFLKDEIAFPGDREYLSQLFQQVESSPEFESVTVTLRSLPDSASSRLFLDQFLGPADATSALLAGHLRRERMMRKKARIMEHWAKKIGAEVAIADQE